MMINDRVRTSGGKATSVVGRALSLLLAAGLVAGVAGCDSEPSEQALANVNGREVSAAEFEAFLKLKRAAVNDDKHRQALLDQYLEREALAAAIENEKSLDASLVKAELNEFRKEMLISRYFEQYLQDQVTDQAINNYYTANVDKFQERKAKVAHILTRTRHDMPEAERDAKRTAIQAALSQLKAGKDFAAVAKEYSEDAVSAAKGGELGWLKEGAIDPTFSKTAFGLEPGKYSDPIETPFGFHIVKLIEEPQVVRQPFEAVRGDIRYQLRAQAKQAELERLIGKSKIEKATK